MAYVLRSVFFIGVVYALSPVQTGADPARHGTSARATGAALARTSAELARLSGEPAEIALKAARSWASLDEASRDQLRGLIAATIAAKEPATALSARSDSKRGGS